MELIAILRSVLRLEGGVFLNIVNESNHNLFLGLVVVVTGFSEAVGQNAGLFINRVKRRRFSGWMLRLGLLLRLTALLALFGLALLSSPARDVLALVLFLVVVLSWSLLVVASTDRAAELAAFPEGEALGLYGATGAVAAVIGSLLGGILAVSLGYGSLLGFGATGVALALVLDRGTS